MEQNSSENPVVTGFFRYDRFPYMLSRTGTLTNDSYIANVANEPGYRYGPCFAILPKSAGEELTFKLRDLESSYDNSRRELEQKYKAERDKILKVYNIKHPQPAVDRS